MGLMTLLHMLPMQIFVELDSRLLTGRIHVQIPSHLNLLEGILGRDR